MTSTETSDLGAQRQGQRRRAFRTAPLSARCSSSARMLAQRGAMAPEGVTARNLERTRSNFRVPVPTIKRILGVLWDFRLLGWFPGDALYLTFEQMEQFVSQGTRRPADTQDLMPDWFTLRYSADDLRELRSGKEA
ncbi:hypothetical protein GOB08_11700 [Sinorhizobium meliloti]|nr:hypothetical protein [Sinorhizobium meliloti]MDX0449603.1 hypothetical protein [Sinorhizobium medicae]MDX1058353.1 hypothetical protein [Sinorhizobium medicae]